MVEVVLILFFHSTLQSKVIGNLNINDIYPAILPLNEMEAERGESLRSGVNLVLDFQNEN